jgi:hypothetical protein
MWMPPLTRMVEGKNVVKVRAAINDMAKEIRAIVAR